MGAKTTWISVFLAPTYGSTDGSKIGEAVWFADIMASQLCKKRLPNNSSIFSAEAHGILLALDMIHWSTGSQLLFRSDSFSWLHSLQNWDLSHPLIAEIVCRVHGLISDGTSVVFVWFLVMLNWPVTRRRIGLQKMPYSCQCLTWLSLIWTTNHSYVFRH